MSERCQQCEDTGFVTDATGYPVLCPLCTNQTAEPPRDHTERCLCPDCREAIDKAIAARKTAEPLQPYGIEYCPTCGKQVRASDNRVLGPFSVWYHAGCLAEPAPPAAPLDHPLWQATPRSGHDPWCDSQYSYLTRYPCTCQSAPPAARDVRDTLVRRMQTDAAYCREILAELARLEAEIAALRTGLDTVTNLLCPLCRTKWAALAEPGEKRGKE